MNSTDLLNAAGIDTKYKRRHYKDKRGMKTEDRQTWISMKAALRISADLMPALVAPLEGLLDANLAESGELVIGSPVFDSRIAPLEELLNNALAEKLRREQQQESTFEDTSAQLVDGWSVLASKCRVTDTLFNRRSNLGGARTRIQLYL